MPTCANCGADIGADHVFCDMCGAKVEQAAAPAASQPPAAEPPPSQWPAAEPQPVAAQRPKRRWPIVVAIVAVALLMLCGCAVAGVMLLLPRLATEDGGTWGVSSTVEVPEGYEMAFDETYEDPDFGPEAADSARILMLTPSGDNGHPDIACAVITWWSTSSGEAGAELGDQLDEEWSYSDAVWEDLSSVIPEDSEDVWMHWESRPERSIGVHAEIWLWPDSEMSDDDKDEEASRLCLWALDKGP